MSPRPISHPDVDEQPRASVLRKALEDSEGLALLIVLAALVLVTGLVLVLALSSSVETRISASTRDSVATLHAADAAARRALIDLRAADWNAVLGGAPSSFTDGLPGGVRMLDDGTRLNLDAETADLRCGRTAGCRDEDIASVDEARPWGAQNPRWLLYAYGPLSALLPGDPFPPHTYIASWVADDPTESDADPFRDGAARDNPGRNILLVVGRAYGPGGSRRTVQLVVERVGADLRVLAWHERHP